MTMYHCIRTAHLRVGRQEWLSGRRDTRGQQPWHEAQNDDQCQQWRDDPELGPGQVAWAGFIAPTVMASAAAPGLGCRHTHRAACWVQRRRYGAGCGNRPNHHALEEAQHIT